MAFARLSISAFLNIGHEIRIETRGRVSSFVASVSDTHSDYLSVAASPTHVTQRQLKPPPALHIPPILPPNLIQRMADLPQRVVLHRLDQLLEDIPPLARSLLQGLQAVRR